MKSFFSLTILIVFSLIICIFPLSSCSCKDDITSYDISIIYDDEVLDIEETIHLVNEYETSLDTIKLVSYVYPFTSEGGLADKAKSNAYPFGVNYADFEILSIEVDGASVTYTQQGMYIDIEHSLKPRKGVDITVKYRESVPKNRLRYGYNGTSVNLGNAFLRVVPLYDGDYVEYPYSLNGDPFYDEVATFDVTVDIPASMKAVMSGKFSSDIIDDRRVYTAKAKNVRDFAIVLYDNLHEYRDIYDGVEIVYLTQDSSHSTYISRVKSVLDIFGDIYVKYPYESICVVENDFLEGGMEYPSLIYVNKMLDSASMEKVIIHEMAHQWWYGIIGDNENADYIIDEGMAELSVYLYYLKSGEVDYAEALMKIMKDEYIRYNLNDKVTNKMNLPLDVLTDYEYYAMAYLKAPLMLYDAYKTLGEDKFLSRVKTIIDDYSYDNITVDEFVSYFDDSNMRSYIDGKLLY